MKFTHEDFLIFSPIQPSNYSNSKPSSFLLALIRVCITWTTTLNSLPCICWVLFATNDGLDEGATAQVGSSWDHGETLWNRACHADACGIVGFTCLFLRLPTHHNNLSHWSKKAISACAESVAALQPFLIYNNIWSSSSDTGFLIASYLDEHLDFHMFVLLFTSFYIFLLFNKPLQSFISTDVQGERAKGAKGFKWANTSRGLEMWRDRRAWRIVPNSIQILRNSTNFYPISIQFFQLSGDNVTKHDEQDKQDMKKTCDLNTVIHSNQTADVLDAFVSSSN